MWEVLEVEGGTVEHDPDMGGEEIDVTPLRIPKRTKPVENLEKMLEDFAQKTK